MTVHPLSAGNGFRYLLRNTASAAVVTSGARLLLKLLERCVTDRGGSWAMADTDSMAIVANKDGGTELSDDGDTAIRVLTHPRVEEIRDRFTALNPYDRSAAPGSILRAEADAYCYAIAAKRYALMTYDEQGWPRLCLTRCTQHVATG